MLFAQFQSDNEAASLARFAFHTDGTVMKFDDTFCQSQSDACSGSGIQRVQKFGLIEPVEDFVNFRSGDTRTGILYFDDGMVLLLRNVDGNGIFLFRMFQCIGQ